MKVMKKAILGFLTLLMLTPVMVCAMAYCPMQSAQAADVMPCHDMDDNESLTLAIDCMGGDISFVTDDEVELPDLSLTDVTYDPILASETMLPAAIHNDPIRGPPQLHIHPAERNILFQKSQRIRI